MTRNGVLTLLLAFALPGCTGQVDMPGSNPNTGPVTQEVDSPSRRAAGDADYVPTRQVRRLTADQFYQSLQIATGESWASYDRYARALGRPDLAETTEEGRDVSVTFDKLTSDAARATCRGAVVADRDRSAEESVIVRHAALSDRELAPLATNLRYLFMRFLSVEIVDDTDVRLTPWLSLLMASPAEGEEELTDETMEYRWQAVCIGLATHPDFLNY